MTVNQVQYVCEIAKRGSISKAAEQFYISQPALSEQIKALEQELGYSLLRRTSHGSQLTAAGERFVELAEPAIRAWNLLEQESRELKNPSFTSIRIGFGVRARSNGLFEPMMGFFDGYPDVSFDVITDMNENFPDAVESRRVDIALGRLYGNQTSGIANKIAIFPLMSEPQCLLMSRLDPLCRETALPFSALNGKSVICGPIGSGDDWEMQEMCKKHKVRVSRVLRADDINAVMTLVQCRKGYALGPSSFADYFGVAAVPLTPKMSIALNLMVRKENQNSLMIRQLLQHLKNDLPEADS